ncbi:unnamed protein product, partial [Mesorhabditis spiculigera]
MAACPSTICRSPAADVRRLPSQCPTTRLLHAVLRSPCAQRCSPTRPATQTTSAWLRQLQAFSAMFDNAVSATAAHHRTPRLPFATTDTWQWRFMRRHSSWHKDNDMPSNFAASRVYFCRNRKISCTRSHNLLFDNVIIHMVVTFHDVYLSIDTAANVAYFYRQSCVSSTSLPGTPLPDVSIPVGRYSHRPAPHIADAQPTFRDIKPLRGQRQADLFFCSPRRLQHLFQAAAIEQRKCTGLCVRHFETLPHSDNKLDSHNER